MMEMMVSNLPLLWHVTRHTRCRADGPLLAQGLITTFERIFGQYSINSVWLVLV